MFPDQAMAALLAAKEAGDAPGWQRFQADIHTLKLQRTRVLREAEDVRLALYAAEAEYRQSLDGTPR